MTPKRKVAGLQCKFFCCISSSFSSLFLAKAGISFLFNYLKSKISEILKLELLSFIVFKNFNFRKILNICNVSNISKLAVNIGRQLSDTLELSANS